MEKLVSQESSVWNLAERRSRRATAVVRYAKHWNLASATSWISQCFNALDAALWEGKIAGCQYFRLIGEFLSLRREVVD